MKEVKVGLTTYYIQNEDDLITVSHELAREGYTVQEIAQFLGVTERKVKKMLEDCW